MAKKSEFDIIENVDDNSDLEEFRAGLIQIGLKGIDDIKNKRVQNPNAFIEALAALYVALKN